MARRRAVHQRHRDKCQRDCDVAFLYFVEAWIGLAVIGYCDPVNSAEYRRVLREWMDDGMPLASPADYIINRANVPVEGDGQ